MSIIRLQEARNRLEQAVARLEQAMRDRPHPQVNGDDTGLAEELHLVRTRCEALERRSQDVSNRLSVTIERVKGLLED